MLKSMCHTAFSSFEPIHSNRFLQRNIPKFKDDSGELDGWTDGAQASDCIVHATTEYHLRHSNGNSMPTEMIVLEHVEHVFIQETIYINQFFTSK